MDKINLSKNTLDILKRKNFVDKYIRQHDYIKLYNLIKNMSVQEKRNIIQKINDETKNYIEKCFHNSTLEEACFSIEAYIKKYPFSNKQKIKDYYESELKNNILKEKFLKVLKIYDFQMADRIFEGECFPLDFYEKLKSEYICKYFKSKYDINIDKFQSDILGTNSSNILVTARAGSGKTRTIACRAIYALEKEDITPEEILILAFNKDAAKEIRTRIKNEWRYAKIYDNNIRTFHSLAYSIVLPKENILFDYAENAIRSNFEEFLNENVLSILLNDEYYRKIYDCFHNTDEIIDYEFYKKNRNNRQLYTLNGEKVKSNGEKYIADFLFEHGIDYQYEKVLTQKRNKDFGSRPKYKLYRPDFTIYLNNKTYVIEHWGIDETDTAKIVPDFWDKTWDEYKKEMEWKRETISNNRRGIILLETSICDLKKGRKVFENLLKTILEANGIKCIKLPKEVLVEKFTRKMAKQINKNLITFIQKAKNYQITPDEIDFNLQVQCKNLSYYARTFIKLANEAYKLYEYKLKITNNTDFPKLLFNAKEKIENGHYKIELKNNIIQDLTKIKLLLIDEFQDFSTPFYGIINAIQKCNPNVRLFCVGDDWQAINGFAGSDLKFYKNFEKYFGLYTHKQLIFNYRSNSNIVKYGNAIMDSTGQGGKAINRFSESEIAFIEITETTYENQITEKSEDYKYIFESQNKNSRGSIYYFSIASRYLKECVEKIKKLNMENKNYTYLILTRDNYIDSFVDMKIEFQNKLQDILCYQLKIYSMKEFQKHIHIETIHKSKGSEADIVFLLNFGNKNIKIHPDSEIDLIFGRTQQDIIDEELRLYYVAITRAKKNLYIINENINNNNTTMDFSIVN